MSFNWPSLTVMCYHETWVKWTFSLLSWSEQRPSLRGVLGDWIFALVYSGVTVNKLRSQMESATRPMNAAWSDQLSIFSFSWYRDWHSHAEVLNCCLLNKAHVSATCEPRFSLASEIIFQYDLQIAFLWNHDRPGQYLLNSTGFTAQSYN